MRALISAMLFAFALGGFATSAVQAGEGCDYGGQSVKKNDLETPAPAAATKAKPVKG